MRWSQICAYEWDWFVNYFSGRLQVIFFITKKNSGVISGERERGRR